MIRNIVPQQTNWLVSIPIVVAFVAAPLSGWLADAKFGNYKVFRFGAVLLFISTVMNCLLLILEAFVLEYNQVLTWILFSLGSGLFVVGACACIATALPLGLDQMPDASTSSITCYIVWFVCTIFVGDFLGEALNGPMMKCLKEVMGYQQFYALFLTICMSVVLCSNFLFSPKWLIIEPRSPQSLKTIYKVLKFAAKHKAPLNRSALTYWEEDIPSRMDLGKRKYGGPFTTEQVEDVKTILRLLGFTFLLFFIALSFFFSFDIDGPTFRPTTSCESSTFHFLLYGFTIYGFLGALVHEFLVYPIFRNKLPSILRRIGAAFLTNTLVSFVCFILKLAHFFSSSSETTTGWIVLVLYRSTNGLLAQVLLTLVLEFMCAQSPYNMRGLLVSLVVPLAIFSTSFGWTLGQFFTGKIDSTCTESWCSLVLISVKVILSLFGFLLFCIVARWYKMRVRDEDYSPQRVVEEVYDRYLTAAAAQSRRYGTIN